MTSYHFAERYNAQTIFFYGLALPAYRAATAIDKGCQAIRAALPHLLFALAILAKTLGLVAVIAVGAFLALTFWVVLAKLVFGLAVVTLFGWATFPQGKAVRNG